MGAGSLAVSTARGAAQGAVVAAKGAVKDTAARRGRKGSPWAWLKKCKGLGLHQVLLFPFTRATPIFFYWLVPFPFFSAIVLVNNQPFPRGFWWFSGKKDPWKEWGSYP